MMFEQDRVAYIQYCFCGNPYYTLYVIYGGDHEKTDEAMMRMAHPNKLWSLCDSAPSFKDNPILCSELTYNQQLLKINQHLVCQGVLDNCNDVGITET